MKANRYISKCISLFLIVVLLQKAGGGLYLHNWLHSQNTTSSSGAHAIGFNSSNCTCIDDFYLPFTETPEPIIQAPLTESIEFAASLKTKIPFSLTFFHLLRGPPSKA